ncbi:MAG: TonB-dependent receptor [Balneola sp.]|nr:MAG: TonB-dependent receptor [Balneola sp.]
MMKTAHYYVFVCLFSLLFYSLSNAQIGGIVKDSKNFSPISDVHISIVGTDLGTNTDQDGRFSLPYSTFPVTLELSVLGYESRSLQVYRSDSTLAFFMKPTVLSLDEIVIAPDRTINPITNTSPIARSSVTIEQLSDKSTVTAVELLRAESGVFVQQTSVGQGSIYIRGRAGRDVLYLFNGMRMNPSFVRSGQNQYFGAIDPLLINKLDVYRGPISVYYGSDALSGGVNISPIIYDFSEDSKLSGDLVSTFNFEGNGEKTVHGKFAYQTPKASFFLGGSLRDFDYYKMSSRTEEALWFPYDATLSNADYSFKSMQFSSKIKTSTESDLTVVSYYGEIPDAARLDRITLGFSIEAQESELTPQFGYYSNTSPLLFWGNTVEFRTSKVSKAFESIGIKGGYFRLKDFRKEQDFAFNNAPEYSVNIAERDYLFEISDTTNFDQNTSNQYHFSVDIRSALSKNMYLKWGGDVSFDRVQSSRHSNTGQVQLPRYPDGSVYILSGLFAQIDQLVSEKLSMEYGVRYSQTYASIPFEGILTDRRYDPYSASYSQLTGSVGLTYKLSKDIIFLSNLSSGFRAPNISDLSEVGIRRSDQFQTPNTELRPEKTGNFDIGIQYQSDRFFTEMYAFWLHYFDKITRIETGNIVDEYGNLVDPATSPDPFAVYNEVTNENANSMDLLGIEFRGSYQVNPTLKSGLTFTYTWGNLTNENGTSEPADRVPPANGIFYLDYSPVKKLSIRPQARYAFAHRRISPDEIGDIRISQNGTDGFVNLQLFINYKALDHFSIKLIADNLTDAAYREHASSLDGMGRNYTATVSYSF